MKTCLLPLVGLVVMCLASAAPAALQAEEPKERLRLEGHRGAVYSVAYSPNGKLLATASEDGTVKLWSVAKMRCFGTLRGHAAAVRSVAFSRDGAVLASGGDDGTVQVWETATGEAVAVLRTKGSEVLAVALSPDGKKVASGHPEGLVRVWNVATGKATPMSEESGDVTGLAFSPEGETLAVAGQLGGVSLWDPAKGRRRSRIDQAGAGYAVAFSPDGKTFVSGHCYWSIWDASTARELRRFKGTATPAGAAHSVAFTPDGKTVGAATTNVWGGEVHLYDAATGDHLVAVKSARRDDRGRNAVHSIAFSPDGKTLASGGDGEVKLWDVPARKKGR